MNYGVTQIAQLFPSLKRIKDKSLREKVAAVWNEAITTGCGGEGWAPCEVRGGEITPLGGGIHMTFLEQPHSCAPQLIRLARVFGKTFRLGNSHYPGYLIAG